MCSYIFMYDFERSIPSAYRCHIEIIFYLYMYIHTNIIVDPARSSTSAIMNSLFAISILFIAVKDSAVIPTIKPAIKKVIIKLSIF